MAVPEAAVCGETFRDGPLAMAAEDQTGWIAFTVDGREVRAPGGRAAARRGQARRRRGAVLLLRAEARRARGRMPDVPRRDRGNPEAADVVLHPGEGRNGRLHADQPCQGGPERGGRVPAREPPARLPRLRQGRRVPTPGHLVRAGPRAQPLPPTRNGTSQSRSRCRPLVAIDRERCILCYRCVRFSPGGRRGLPAGPFLERADHTFVGTFDGRPYVAPFAGTSSSRAPSGALTSTAYRFRVRPWDIVDAGSVCTLCPSQSNIAFTVRDERVERVLARDNEAVDDGWLCDKGRWGYQA